MKFPDQLAKLARHVADKAALSDTPFSETLDALGKLTTYYALMLKNAGKSSDEDEDVPTISQMTARMREVEEPPNGRARVPIGRG